MQSYLTKKKSLLMCGYQNANFNIKGKTQNG